MERLKFDLHIHSCYSFDSFSRIKDIVKKAIRIGLKGIAVTDHNKTIGSLKAKEFVKERGYDIMVISGVEYTTEKGDVLVLFIDEEIKYQNVQDLIDSVHERDGIVIKAHPFKRESLELGDINIYDGLEGFNARNPYNIVVKDLVNKFDIPQIGGSDAHFLFEIGRGTTVSPYLDNEDELKKLILERETEVSGQYTPLVDVLSQTVKMVKTKKLKLNKIIRQCLKSGREAVSYLSLR